MDELARLELVNKVVSRLEEEVGIGDRTLAEFVIHLAQEAVTPVAFTESLAKNGADFSDDLSRQIFALVEDASTPLPAAPPPQRPKQPEQQRKHKIQANRPTRLLPTIYVPTGPQTNRSSQLTNKPVRPMSKKEET